MASEVVVETSGFVIFFLVLIYLLVIIALVLGGYAVYTHQVGFTGPTGGIGPTGPRAITGVTTADILTSPNMIIGNNLDNGIMNGMNGMMVNDILNNNQIQASCNPCAFYNSQGTITNFQVIPSGNPVVRPQMVKWVINNSNLSYDNNGTFILNPGTYILSGNYVTSVVYPTLNSMNQTNSGGTYRTMALWLRDVNATNVVNEADLYDTVSVMAIPNNPTILSFPQNLSFTLTRQQKMSILTWHDSPTPLEIDSQSRIIIVT